MSVKYIADAIIEHAASSKNTDLDDVSKVYSVELEVQACLIDWMKEKRKEERRDKDAKKK